VLAVFIHLPERNGGGSAVRFKAAIGVENPEKTNIQGKEAEHDGESQSSQKAEQDMVLLVKFVPFFSNAAMKRAEVDEAVSYFLGKLGIRIRMGIVHISWLVQVI
jgi:hypothetical protein